MNADLMPPCGETVETLGDTDSMPLDGVREPVRNVLLILVAYLWSRLCEAWDWGLAADDDARAACALPWWVWELLGALVIVVVLASMVFGAEARP